MHRWARGCKWSHIPWRCNSRCIFWANEWSVCSNLQCCCLDVKFPIENGRVIINKYLKRPGRSSRKMCPKRCTAYQGTNSAKLFCDVRKLERFTPCTKESCKNHNIPSSECQHLASGTPAAVSTLLPFAQLMLIQVIHYRSIICCWQRSIASMNVMQYGAGQNVVALFHQLIKGRRKAGAIIEMV